MKDVIFYEAFAEEEVSLRKHLGTGIKAEYKQNPLQAYADSAPPAPLISIRTHSRIPSSWQGKVKGILSRSSGYDHLMDLPGRIPCGYLANYCARSVAEHAITVMLSLFKQIKKQMEHFSTFNRNGITCRDCFERNLLVVGVGKIGSQIVCLGKALHMNVMGVDLVERVPGLEYTTLELGIPWADAVICALPLTPVTEGLLDFSLLSRIKKGGIFVNISRGEISPLRELAELLNKGILGGIGLDVFEEENMHAAATDYWKLALSLKDRNEVIFTPHNAFNTEESLDRKSKLACESIKQFLQEGHFPDEVPYKILWR